MTPADITDAADKLGIRFSCSAMLPVYEKLLRDHGVTGEWGIGTDSKPDPMYYPFETHKTGSCPCWLGCDSKSLGFTLNPVFK